MFGKKKTERVNDELANMKDRMNDLELRVLSVWLKSHTSSGNPEPFGDWLFEASESQSGNFDRSSLNIAYDAYRDYLKEFEIQETT